MSVETARAIAGGRAPSGRAQRGAALGIAIVAAATIGGALLFQYGWGYLPCKLCLQQRIPYYVAIPVALVTAAVPSAALRRVGLSILGLIFLFSLALGIFHAGVEWHWWLGPADCGGGGGLTGGNVEDLMKALNGVKVVSCTEAAWRLFGISLAGWNALISAALAALAAWAANRRPAF